MVNNVTVNIVVQLSLQDLTLILLDIYPEMELLDQVVIFFFLVLEELPHCFPQLMPCFTFPPAVYICTPVMFE